MVDQQFEFLDMLAIVSFALQMNLMEQMSKQATNEDVIAHLHQDIMLVDQKLDAVMHHLGIA